MAGWSHEQARHCRCLNSRRPDRRSRWRVRRDAPVRSEHYCAVLGCAECAGRGRRAEAGSRPRRARMPRHPPVSTSTTAATAIASAEGRVLLFFHAPWCPQCRSIEADIVAQGVPDGVTIIKVDYDSHQDLRQQYGVTLQTTFVEVDSAGEALQSYVAYDDPHLEAVIDGDAVGPASCRDCCCVSFVAGILTIAAPCVLPLLPVIVGGSIVRTSADADGRRAAVVPSGGDRPRPRGVGHHLHARC